MSHPPQMTEALSNLIAQHPYFAVYMSRVMRPKYDPETKTAATNGVDLVVGDWFCQLPIRQRVFTLAHEALHSILNHCPRAALYRQRGFAMDLKPFSDKRANYAMDYVINAVLISSKIGDMPPGGLLRSLSDADMTWDEVYLEIDEPPEDDPENWDEHLPPPPDAPDEGEVKQAVAQARNTAKIAGNLPGALARLFGDILEPKVDWKVALREFVEQHAGKDETSWSRLNKRRLILPPGIPMPGRTGHRMPCLVVAVDTSGSISDYVLNQFLAEIRKILEDVRPEETHLIWWDTAAAHVQIEEPEDLASQSAYGGGGTNWDCVPDKINELGLEPTVMITLTDGYVDTRHTETPWPHLTVTTSRPMPFGTNITLEV